MFRLSALAIAAALGISFSGAPIEQPAMAANMSCEVKTAKRGGAVVVEGFVTAAAGVSGSYRISVGSSGGDTDQSGEFKGNGSRISLGFVPVAGSGDYKANIVIKVGGETHCTSGTSGKI